MTKRVNRADMLIFKALQKAIKEEKLNVCLILSRVNVPGSPIYNPWECLLPILCPILLGLILVWAVGILFGLTIMIVGIILSANLIKKKLEMRLIQRAKAELIKDYNSFCNLWKFGGLVLVKAEDNKMGCIAPEGDWKEFVVKHFADFMVEQKTPELVRELDNEKAA
jgi:hypothetical protein